MNEMTVVRFDRLKHADFENGAVRDEIREALKTNFRLKAEVERLSAAIGKFLSNESIAEYERGRRQQDMAFAEEVPEYKRDCENITAVFDALRKTVRDDKSVAANEVANGDVIETPPAIQIGGPGTMARRVGDF